MNLETLNISGLSDVEMVVRMRKCNKGKFKTLVRMHLSFELDLNTDEFSLPCHEIVYENKGKLKKCINKNYKHGSTGITSSSTNLKSCTNGTYNSSQEVSNLQVDAGFLLHLSELKDFLMLEKNILQEGIFRKTGSVPRQRELKLKIQKETPLNLLSSDYSIHDCATVFKGYLADLSEPLLTDAHYTVHTQIAPLCQSVNASIDNKETTDVIMSSEPDLEKQTKEAHLLNCIQLLLLDLPEENRQLLQHVIDILHAVAKRQHINNMGPHNLAILFTPHLICPRNLPSEGLHYISSKLSSIVSYMIIKGQEIFSVPPKLATDIRAYILECKFKQTMSPEIPLDESLLDASTANTVYTFVDREKTAAAHNINTTETELAQLYAHIQSLPESARKRRLIKQFNKQNGQGIPLSFQSQTIDRTRNIDTTRSTKSLSDSIKKHIFHRGVMRKSPKRHPCLALEACTPITGDLKKQKQQRTLFQSPYPLPTPTHTSTVTPIKWYNKKMQPLHHFTSSSLMSDSCNSTTCSLSYITSLNCPATKSDSVSGKRKSSSAPVSRQISDEMPIELNTQSLLNTSPASQYSAIDTASNYNLLRLNSKINNKSITWEDIDEFSNVSTQTISSNDLKSRYKSEPNLSLCDTVPNVRHDLITPISELMPGKYIIRKLMKGVSVGNLRFPFAAAESTKRLVRTVSSSLKRRTSYRDDDFQSCPDVSANSFTTNRKTYFPLISGINNIGNAANNFSNEDSSDNEECNDGINENCSKEIELVNTIDENYGKIFTGHMLTQESSKRRSTNLITSTPSLLSDRRSMSPITKSTQRMPKAMQESIITPRSRKPVMVLTTTNNTGNYNEQSQNDDNNALITKPKFNFTQDGLSSTILKDLNVGNYNRDVEDNNNSASPLSTNFKKYLLKRSVFANSPEDASFSSHSDDFCSSQEIEDLEEDQLSTSLLYCLDGNKPKESNELSVTSTTVYKNSNSEDKNTYKIGRRPRIITNRLAMNPFVILNNARKLASSTSFNINSTTLVNENITQCVGMDVEMQKDKTSECVSLEGKLNSSLSSNKENIKRDFQSTKKFLATEYPGETSF